ncbi:MAG: 1-deoxy-D-xylulose-5-phosphate reductoisomerase [Crocinitomix sp.]|nr:1-deoxy-D-xylulose-5-phosphate reductoisomerase [Crocinitomix sp.]
MSEKKKIALLGSTGSIGTQTLEVVRTYPEKFEFSVLTANRNADLLIEQAIEFRPNVVVIVDESLYEKVNSALFEADIKVYTGEKALAEVTQMDEVNIVITAIVGFSGLKPTIAAIEAGKNIALANKETLVVAGEIITKLARQKGVNIYPVDSEHSAIFQCLTGEYQNPIEKIYLTASGGPFRGKKRADLANTTKEQALKHPNWEMGAKITIDSASMMNKGLEVIEAKWLFGLKNDQIDVIVHPQSIVHSLVQFKDGSMKAQMGLPDMKLPIQYALTYPNRLQTDFERFNFMDYPTLTFEQPDLETFTNLRLAYDVMEQGGNMPCVLNAANEISVAAFLNDEIKFLDIASINKKTVSGIDFIKNPSLEQLFETDLQARDFASNLIG